MTNFKAKAATLVMGLVALLQASPANAVYAPGWERPVKMAEMEILEADGFFKDAENVVLTQNRRDDSEHEASSFTLTFDLKNNDGSTEKASYLVPVDAVSYNRCGGTTFVATLKLYNPEIPSGYFPKIEIRLQRQTAMGVQRSCGGRSSVMGTETRWNAEVKFTEQGSVQSESLMTLRGSPEAVFTIQGAESL